MYIVKRIERMRTLIFTLLFLIGCAKEPTVRTDRFELVETIRAKQQWIEYEVDNVSGFIEVETDLATGDYTKISVTGTDGSQEFIFPNNDTLIFSQDINFGRHSITAKLPYWLTYGDSWKIVCHRDTFESYCFK